MMSGVSLVRDKMFVSVIVYSCLDGREWTLLINWIAYHVERHNNNEIDNGCRQRGDDLGVLADFIGHRM